MLEQSALDLLFNDARTYNNWQDKPISDELLHKLYHLVKMGPTSANCSPARFVFISSDEGKKRLKPHLDEGNIDKTMSAPVVVLVGQDMEFYEKLPELFPHTDAKSWFVGNDDLIRSTAFRNATLQGGYLIMAARALGLDTGPMSGFDGKGAAKEFFKDGNIEANFLINLGYGVREGLFPRSPRLSFDDAAEIV